MEIAISGKILTYVSYILIVYCGLELVGGMEEAIALIDKQTATIKRNKEILFITSLFGVSAINAWKMFEKIKMDTEKRRALKLDNDLKEEELKRLKNENN